MTPREKLIEYLCALQHKVYEEQALLEGWETHRDIPGSDWRGVPEANKATMRASMAAVLDELQSLGARIPEVVAHVVHS